MTSSEVPIESSAPFDDGVKLRVLEAARGPVPVGQAPDLIHKFRAQVRRRPDHPAVEATDQRLSYRQLDLASDRLARALVALGVGPGLRVGVALPRGARELTALLAILKAGGAYVPIDITHPIDRIRMIIEDAAPQVLIALSDAPLPGALPPGVVLLKLDLMPAEPSAAESTEQPVWPAPGEEVAYVLFTSGSTGRPKGVEIPRAALANFLRSMERRPGLGENDRLLAITTTTFDIAGLELFLPLWVGATIVIADRDTVRDPWLLGALIQRERPTVMQATPATWRSLLEAGWRGDGRLRMLCGGDMMSPPLAERLLPCGSELWNMYGPTETTIWSTVERIEAGGRITIGRPIDHTQVYVLDETRNLVPPGVVGELYIGGRGLARGYLDRPDLTAERFLPDPFGPPGGRIYRVGDLGRLLDDGRFECLGRIDHQVKIRGFRIELGEIEAALRGAPGVSEALVIARGSSGRDPELCAYWTGEASRQALYEAAVARVPAYMVPSSYVHLDAFPLNTNGKIDRIALPTPGQEAAGAVEHGEGEAAPPLNDTEAFVSQLWRRLLRLTRVDPTDNFFALGGDSLMAVMMLSAVERQWHANVRVSAFVHEPTVQALATLIEEAQAAGDSVSEQMVVTIQEGPGTPLWLIHPAGGHVVYGERLRVHMRPDQPILGIQSRGLGGKIAPLQRIDEMADLYCSLVLTHQPHGPYQFVGSSMGGLIAIEIAERLEKRGEKVALLGLFDTSGPIYPRRISRVVGLIDHVRDLIEGRDWNTVKIKARQVKESLFRQPAADRPWRYGPLPTGRGEGPLLDTIERVAQANQQAADDYQFHTYGCRVTLLRATKVPRWPGRRFDDPTNSFGPLVPAGIEVVPFACTHLNMLDEPHVGELGRWLQRRLDHLREQSVGA